MEVLGATAGIVQLIAQITQIVQAIRRGLTQVRQGSALVASHQAQLDNFNDTLELIQKESHLHTSNIRDQLIFVSSICQTIQSSLSELQGRHEGSRSRQFLHAIITTDDDKNVIHGHFERLDRAVSNLNTRILTTTAGIASDMQGGLLAAWPIVQRVDQNVERILSPDAAIGRNGGIITDYASEGRHPS
ncbi:hypothetical protein FDECE_3846 [Fusarium decemcellulare]|nr:hypothetical protein FDECE_3846 [Fusarium decemcellulare]